MSEGEEGRAEQEAKESLAFSEINWPRVLKVADNIYQRYWRGTPGESPSPEKELEIKTGQRLLGKMGFHESWTTDTALSGKEGQEEGRKEEDILTWHHAVAEAQAISEPGKPISPETERARIQSGLNFAFPLYQRTVNFAENIHSSKNARAIVSLETAVKRHKAITASQKPAPPSQPQKKEVTLESLRDPFLRDFFG
jgi:hypothetical protein